MAAAPTQRLSYGALSAAVGGGVLIISLFIDWAGVGSFSVDAWQAFSLLDIVLFAIGIAAIVLAATEHPAVTIRAPFEHSRVLTILGIVATTIVWSTIFETEHLKIGIFLAGIASIAILVGGIMSERAPSEGFAFGGRDTAIAGGGGLGGGGGSAAAAGGAGEPAAQAPASSALGGGGAVPAADEPAAGESVTAVQAAAEEEPAAEASPAIQSAPLGDEMPAPPDRPGQPADWYSDPTGLKRLRYWDGNQWTEHVAD